MSIERRQKAIWVAGGMALLAAMGVGLLAGMFVRTGPGHLPPSLVVLGCAVLVGTALLASVPWWRKLDDMARDAHLTSWYWGASFGGGVALMVTAAMGGVQGELFQGGVMVFGAQAVVYLVFWLGWWALRRPRAS